MWKDSNAYVWRRLLSCTRHDVGVSTSTVLAIGRLAPISPVLLSRMHQNARNFTRSRSAADRLLRRSGHIVWHRDCDLVFKALSVALSSGHDPVVLVHKNEQVLQ